MAATSWPGTDMDKLLRKLRADFTDIHFEAGTVCHWSPRDRKVTFVEAAVGPEGAWSLLHELAHGLLEHTSYDSDFELLLLEVAAWEKAKKLAREYGYKINEEHLQDCLDTYRDWLYQRSTCPNCMNSSLQQSPTTYRCFNCAMSWRVSSSRLCRPYRRVESSKQ